MGKFEEKTLEVQGKELEEVNHEHNSVYVSQSFRKSGDSDSEQPEEDPEEEPEEDSEEEPEEDSEEEPEEQAEEVLVEGSEVESEDDPEEDSSEEQYEKLAVECASPFQLCNEIVSAEQLTEHEDKDPSEKGVFEPNLESETEPAYQNNSDGKQRMVVNTAFKPPLSQNYLQEKNCKYDEPFKQKFNLEYAATDQHSVQGGIEDVGGTENSRKQVDTGTRRRSRWDQDPEDDKKTVVEDKKGKKRKTRWDNDDSTLRFEDPLQLIDSGKGLSGSLLDLEAQALKRRLSEINSILLPPVNNELGIRVYEHGKKRREKLTRERQKILSELVKPPKNNHMSFCKKLFVPVKEYPTYNFIGLILGPKGNTQKRMEMESGAKIRLRGKGSLKTSQEADPSENIDLHVYIEASSQKSLDAAVCMVEKLLIPVEEGKNEHKRAQLVELYKLKTATLNNSCSVCKEPGHNHFACPQKKSTLKAACDTCGSFSHPTSGCVTASNSKINSKEISAANLYVGFLPHTIDDSRLRELFSPFGTIIQSRVVIDQRTGHSKGYGFVKFDTPADANLAIMHMNGYQMDGHKLAVKIAGTPPATGSLTTSLLPVYPGPAAVAASRPVLPHYMLPEAQVSFLNGKGLGFPPSSLNIEHISQFPRTGVAVIPPIVSRSSGPRTALSSTGVVSGFTESRTEFLSTGLVSGFTESRTALSSTALVSGSTESRTALSSTALVSGSDESRSAFTSAGLGSVFPGDPDYPGSGFQSYFPGDPDYRGSGFQSYFPGDPDYRGSGFQSYFTQ